MKLNDKILRVLLQKQASLDTPVLQLYKKFNTLPLPDLHRFYIIKFVHNLICHKDKLSCIFSSYFRSNQMFHSYNKRTDDSLRLESFTSNIGQSSSRYRVACYGILYS